MRGTQLFAVRSGGFGTWRTSNSGAAWVQVDGNESGGGVYQPDTNGVVYMPGIDSALGNGVLRSTDYGQTWAHVGLVQPEVVVFGTTANVYAMFGAAIGPTGSINPNPEVELNPVLARGWRPNSSRPGRRRLIDHRGQRWNLITFSPERCSAQANAALHRALALCLTEVFN